MEQAQKLVVVSGASTGLGAALARELARQGFHVLAGVRREPDADAIRAAGIEPVLLDITEPAQVAALAARVDGDTRPLHAVVNNAGIQVNGPVETLPTAQWRRAFEVNLFGHVAVGQALRPVLLRSGGRVVNVSSIGGRLAMPTYGAYAGARPPPRPDQRRQPAPPPSGAGLVRAAREIIRASLAPDRPDCSGSVAASGTT